jgi:hypothetical protein
MSTKNAEAAAPAETPKGNGKGEAPRAPRVSQADLPRRSLRDALRVPQAIQDNYAGDPTAPHDVALGLDISPTSSSWRELTGAAQGYGLVKGGYNADRIALDVLGKRAVAPTEEGDDLRAKAEAALKPKVFGDFFRKYDRNKFPPDHIAKNVLQQQFNVPADKTDAVLELIKDNGQYVGFIRETKTGPFVAIDNPQPVPVRLSAEPVEAVDDEIDIESITPGRADVTQITPTPAAPSVTAAPLSEEFTVFITHGKNLDVVEQVKDILSLYDIEYEIAVEEETAAIPVPQKVMEAMRRSHAGVMVVTADEHSKVGEQYTINTNVLIEIGAAFVLYDQRVILLWDKRLKVPSNLQGLYRLEFEGNELSFNTGTKLAKAVKSLRK